MTRVLDLGWIEVETEHFTITSEMSQHETERLARSLELFHAAVLLITNIGSLDSNVPTRVFFFAKESTFRPFQPGRNIAGYFHDSLRANFVAILDARRMDAERILRHEYVHFLMHNGSARIYPRWYDEGFAELLSTTRQMGAYVAVGAVPKDRIWQLRQSPWIPIRRILAYDGTGEWADWEVGMFYAESWALLHYLSRDFEHAVKLGPSVELYLERIEQGSGIDEACEAAFGMGVKELDRKLRKHLDDGSFSPLGVRIDRLAWNEDAVSGAPSRAELAERMGELSLFQGNFENAEGFFREALVDDPELARAYGGLGDIFKQRGEWAEAEKHFSRAVELAPDDPLNELDYGEYWLARADAPGEVDLRLEFLKRARVHVLRALDLDEWKPEPWAIQGATFLVEGADARESVEWLEQALSLQPSSVEIQLMLAEAYIALDRRPEASMLLTRITSWGHGTSRGMRAQQLLDAMEEAPEKGAD